MIVNTNISSLNAQRNFGANNTSMSKTLEKLSSGLRINRAADDAAGLAISEKMRGQFRGLNQAVKNAQTGISLIQTAEGALNESHSILQRMRELAVQSATDTNTTDDRAKIQLEVSALTAELDRIADTTQFNTMNLLDGTFNGKVFHIGANAGQKVDVAITGMGATALKVNSAAIDLKTQVKANSAIGVIDTAINKVSEERSKLGAIQNRLEHTINNLQVASENLTASESRIRDADMAAEMSAFVKSQILSQAGVSMLAQANQLPQTVLKLLG
ncbi:MAG: flagellin [Peptococcaceae bacterium]|nr:flagellin [Peptococcaceae bacterium]MDR2737095.1 flagellin [Gracilibacteraceae bacterium]